MAQFFYVEEMNWRAMAKRARESHKKKNGKNTSKKRFGRSIENRAPAMFIQMLKIKVAQLGGAAIEINTRMARASQYDPTNGTCRKKMLRVQWADLSDGNSFQRISDQACAG